MANITSIFAGVTDKLKAIALLQALIDLIQADRLRVSQIADMSDAAVLEMAEAEAAKAVEGAGRLKNA